MSRRKLYHDQPAATSAAAFNSNSTLTTITAATVQNTTASPVTLTCWIVDNGVSVGDASLVFEGLSVAGNDRAGLPLLVGHTMASGQELHLQASSATALTVRISGDVHS